MERIFTLDGLPEPAGPGQAADRRERARAAGRATCSPRPARRRPSRTAIAYCESGARLCLARHPAGHPRRHRGAHRLARDADRAASARSGSRTICSRRSASPTDASAASRGCRHDRLRLPPRIRPPDPPAVADGAVSLECLQFDLGVADAMRPLRRLRVPRAVRRARRHGPSAPMLPHRGGPSRRA